MNTLFIPTLLWVALTGVCLFLVVRGLRFAMNKLGYSAEKRDIKLRYLIIGLAIWVFLLCALARAGVLSDFSHVPPRLVLAILLPLPLVIGFSFSSMGSRLVMAIPSHWVIGLQVFRLVVELLLWRAFLNNLLPVQMTFEGGNLDILTGIIALPAAYLIWKKKSSTGAVSWIFNLLGLALLINILVISLLSMPTPLRHFMNEPSSRIVGEFPFILLPGVLVPLAYSLHIVSLRQLALKRRTDKNSAGGFVNSKSVIV